jgi:hypothetical protein
MYVAGITLRIKYRRSSIIFEQTDYAERFSCKSFGYKHVIVDFGIVGDSA